DLLNASVSDHLHTQTRRLALRSQAAQKAHETGPRKSLRCKDTGHRWNWGGTREERAKGPGESPEGSWAKAGWASNPGDPAGHSRRGRHLLFLTRVQSRQICNRSSQSSEKRDC